MDSQAPGIQPGSAQKAYSHSYKENAPQSRTVLTSVFNKDRQPLHGILRNTANASNHESLKENFSSLEGAMEDFKSKTRARNDVLGRSALLNSQLQPKQPSSQELSNHEPNIDVGVMDTTAAAARRGFPPAPPVRVHACPDDTSGLTAALPSSREPLISIPATDGSSKVAQAAACAFNDPDLQKLCHEGLHKELTRTRDGATDETRKKELAELVKTLRKGLKGMCQRTSMYITDCVRLEKEWGQQVEAVKLTSIKNVRELEAEIASLKFKLAGFESERRNDVANLARELDQAKMAERVINERTQERDEARDRSRTLEQQRQQMEQDIRELQKLLDQQRRQTVQLSAIHDETLKSVNDEKTFLENKLAGLQDEHSRALLRLKAAEDGNKAFEVEVDGLRTSITNLMEGLRGKDAGAAMQAEELTRVQKESAQLREQVKTLQAEKQRALEDLQRSRTEGEELMAALDARLVDLEGLRAQLATTELKMKEEQEAWDNKLKEHETAVATAAKSEAELQHQKKELKAALELALYQKEQETVRADTEAAERAALLRERTNLVHQVEFAESGKAKADQTAANLNQQLQRLQEEMAERQQVLEDKDARIATLEGEFAALKDVLGDTAGGSGESGKEIVTKLLSKIATLQSNLAAADAVRRKLHNELVDIRGNIRVYCRVKPHPTPATRLGADGVSVAVSVDSREHGFTFDRVFGPDSTQEAVFGGVSELVQSALDGYHVCIFSYGQTGAGKTHTMQGGNSPASRGIIPRSIEKVLATRQKLEELEGWQYRLTACFIEVYNQGLRDLLGGANASVELTDQNPIKHDAKGGHTTIVGARQLEVNDMETAMQLMQQAAAARAVDATAMNAASSRSHSVFMLNITGVHEESGTQLQGSLCLVDLAGSERLDRSKAVGDAKKETCAINSSLSALGDVFQALSGKQTHVPYRNSKLTYLLQPCLGGNGKTLMFVNINPEPDSAGESLCSLRFAAKVNGCETGAKGGARRNVLASGPAGGSGGAGAAASAGEHAGGSSILPRAQQGSGVDLKRTSMLPQRTAADGGSARLAPAARTQTGVGLKRPATAMAATKAAKRTKS